MIAVIFLGLFKSMKPSRETLTHGVPIGQLLLPPLNASILLLACPKVELQKRGREKSLRMCKEPGRGSFNSFSLPLSIRVNGAYNYIGMK